MTLTEEQRALAESDEFLDLMNGVGLAKPIPEDLDIDDLVMIHDWLIRQNCPTSADTLRDFYGAMVDYRFPPNPSQGMRNKRAS
jgi:hypothetical protein